MLPTLIPMAAASHLPGQTFTCVSWGSGREKALEGLLWRKETILIYLVQVPASLALRSPLCAVSSQDTLRSKGTDRDGSAVLILQISCTPSLLGHSELLLP